MSNPCQPRLLLLVRCTKCEGEGYYETETDGICNCPRCEDGWESAAVPASVFLNCYASHTPAEQGDELLRDYIRTQEPTGHSLLSHQSDDLPASALEKVRRQLPAL